MNDVPHRQPEAVSAVTRRRFIGASAALGSTALMLPRAAQAAGTSLEGYTQWPSVTAGGTLDFFLRDPQAVGSATTVYPITFTRTGPSDVYMSSTTVAIGNPGVPADASANGCRWPRSFRLTVPSNWPSGLYYAYIGSDANACTVPFVVRPAAITAGVKALVCVPVLTAHAYNAYGGKSIYDFNSSGGVRGTQVSLDRPFTDAFNNFFDSWSQSLVRWLAKNNIAVDYCTDLDIEATPGVLNGYQLYVQAGHDEYWTSARRNTMDGFVANGGNAAYLGGNTAWWQIRLAASNGVANRTLVCYKDAAADPITDPTLKTTNWISLATPRPENQTTGLGFISGCSWANAAIPRPSTPFAVMRADHWAFAGTNLAQGAGFAGSYVGYECNSALFGLGADQRAYPTGADGTPATLRILAQADGSNWNALSLAAGGSGEQSGYATVSVFSRGGTAGTVFSAASTDWAYGLKPELNGQTPTPISRITLNVFNKLSAVYSETADVRQFHKVVSGAVWNTYYTTGTTAPAGSGLALDGAAFRALVLPVTGSVPVYRYRSATAGSNGTRYRYSRNAALDASGLAWVLEATAFHAYAAARADATAVYEHTIYNPATLELSCLYSMLPTPPAGWNVGPVAFYVPLDGAAAPVVGPGFTLTSGSASFTAYSGQAVAQTITVNPLGGFTGTVAFTVGPLPPAVTAKFTATSSSTGTQLKVNTDSTTPPGTYAVTVTGTASGGLVASVTVLLVVVPAPSFTLTPSATDLRLPFSGLFGGSVAVGVSAQNGFTGAVSFTVSGVPSGMVAYFSPTTSSTGSTLVLSKNLLALASVGTFVLTITGTAGGLTATTKVNLTLPLLL